MPLRPYWQRLEDAIPNPKKPRNLVVIPKVARIVDLNGLCGSTALDADCQLRAINHH
jgi:hypothetical protein